MFGSVIRPEVVVLVDHLLASIVCKQAYFPTEKNFALGLNNTPDELAKLWLDLSPRCPPGEQSLGCL
jgi:hypothetical protein